MSSKNEKLYAQLDTVFDEIKELILHNSAPIVAEMISEKHSIAVDRRALDNYLFHHRSDFDVIECRKKYQKFDFKKAQEEDADAR